MEPLSSYSKPQYRAWNALRLRTGALLWSYVTGQSYYGIVSSPAVLNGKLYSASGDGNLYRFSLGDAVTERSTLTIAPNSKPFIRTCPFSHPPSGPRKEGPPGVCVIGLPEK